MCVHVRTFCSAPFSRSVLPSLCQLSWPHSSDAHNHAAYSFCPVCLVVATPHCHQSGHLSLSRQLLLSSQVPLCPSLFGRSGQVLFANHAVASAVSWVQHVASGWVWCGPGSCAAVGASSHTEVLRNFAAPLCWSSLPIPLQSLAPLIGGAARRAAFTSGLCVQGFRPPA